MDVKEIIKERGANLVQELSSKTGFAPEQARAFLTRLVDKVVTLFKSGAVDVKSLLAGRDFGAIIRKLDLTHIAKEAGVDATKAKEGATAIMPGLVQMLQKESGGIESLMEGAKAGAGGIMKKVGGLFSGHHDS